MLKKLIKNPKIDIFLFLLIGLISLTWFRGNFLINLGDQALPLDPIYDFKKYIGFPWNHTLSTGIVSSRSIAAFSYYGFFALLQNFGLPLIISEKILYYLIFAGSGLAMFFLINSFFKNPKRIVAISGALFYMFNFYAIFAFWRNFTALSFLYATFPFLLALYIKFLKTSQIKYGLYFLFVFTFISSATFVNPAYIIIVCLPLFLYFIFFICENIKEMSRLKIAVSQSVLLFIFAILLNAWWLIPLFFNLKSEMTNAIVSGGGREVFEISSNQTSFLNLFRLWGPWAFTGRGWGGDPYFPWASVYLTPLFLILSFLIPFVAFCSFLAKPKDKVVLFFILLLLLGLFLMKGAHTPLTGVNRWIFQNIPYFEIFRNQYEKFGIITVLSFAVLIGIGFGVINDFLKKYNNFIRQIIIGALFVLLFGIYMWPYWTGDIIYAGGEITPSARIKIPPYYYELQDWAKNQKGEFKIISLPHQEGTAYRWEHGYIGTDDPTLHFLQKPLLTQNINFGDKNQAKHLNFLFSLFEKNQEDPTLPAQISGSTNVKYVLVHRDLNYAINTPNLNLTAEKIESLLDNNAGFKKIKTFDKIDIYEIKKEFFLPQIYTLQNTNNLSFRRINPTKYEIEIEKTDQPFLLVFSETFNRNWKLYQSNNLSEEKEIIADYPNIKVKEFNHLLNFNLSDVKYLFKQSLFDENHFLINGFANAWFIDPAMLASKDNGKITLILYYKPQSLYYLGIIISTITFSIIIGIFLVKLRHKE